MNRENDYITLYESGSQRPISEYSKTSYTCYFEAIAFLKQKGNKGAFQDLEDSRITPHLKHNNLYAYELPTKLTSINFPINVIRPIIEISLNNFRGEQDLACAFLLSDCLSDLGIPNLNLLEVLKDNNQSCLEAFYWQNAYTSGGDRRRYKPTSEGFTLKIKRKALMAFLDKTEMTLCYDISLSRSTTNYKSEDNMAWHEWRERVEVD